MKNIKREDGRKKLEDVYDKINIFSRLEVINKSQTMVEGVVSISEYDDIRIVLKCKKFNIIFTGTNLSLTCINRENILIEGSIHSITFE